MQLQPCPYRQVSDDGQILCGRIKSGDRAVTRDDCQVCPVAQVNCSHLRATLVHAGHPPLLVRYGNGKTEIWQDPTPPLKLERAACATRVQPIGSPHDCAGCSLRRAPSAASAESRPRMVDPRPLKSNEPARPAIERQVAPVPVTLSASGRPHVRTGAGRIIQLQAWLSQQHAVPPSSTPAGDRVPASPLPQGEERRVGWTD